MSHFVKASGCQIQNQSAINTHISTLVCPSTPDSDALVSDVYELDSPSTKRTAARSDYMPTAAVRWQHQIDVDFDPRLWLEGAWG
jgi:hypothetical protein